MFGLEDSWDKVFMLLLTRSMKKMAALMHDIAVTMPITLPPQEAAMVQLFPVRADADLFWKPCLESRAGDGYEFVC